MPATNTSWTYRVQVGAYRGAANARETYERMVALGFRPSYESIDGMYRVVLLGIHARDIPEVARRVGYAGINEILIREDGR
jgi:cell division protein FtsN